MEKENVLDVGTISLSHSPLILPLPLPDSFLPAPGSGWRPSGSALSLRTAPVASRPPSRQ
eukprot:1435337-Rhodomonas_salina.1